MPHITAFRNGDYGYGSDGYTHKSKPSYKSKNSYTKKNARYVINDTPEYTTNEDTDSYDSDSYSDSSKYKSAGKKKSHKKSKKVVEEVEEVEEESSTTTEEESSTGGDSGEYAPAPAPTPSPKKYTYSTKNKKKDSYKKSDADADAYDAEEASGSEEALIDDTTEEATYSNTDSGTYGDAADSGNTEGEEEEESGGETNISPDSIWDYGWDGSSYGARPWKDVEPKRRAPKHTKKSRKGKWHMAYHL
jgi:hypothetical protein